MHQHCCINVKVQCENILRSEPSMQFWENSFHCAITWTLILKFEVGSLNMYRQMLKKSVQREGEFPPAQFWVIVMHGTETCKWRGLSFSMYVVYICCTHCNAPILFSRWCIQTTPSREQGTAWKEDSRALSGLWCLGKSSGKWIFHVDSPLNSVSFWRSSPSSAVTVSACFTFRFVSL